MDPNNVVPFSGSTYYVTPTAITLNDTTCTTPLMVNQTSVMYGSQAITNIYPLAAPLAATSFNFPSFTSLDSAFTFESQTNFTINFE
jgi:hypothetical protein